MKNKYVKYITVLDFEVGRVFQYKTDEMTDNGEGFCPYERYIIDRGHKLSNCEWMFHDIAQVITRNDYREVIYTN